MRAKLKIIFQLPAPSNCCFDQKKEQISILVPSSALLQLQIDNLSTDIHHSQDKLFLRWHPPITVKEMSKNWYNKQILPFDKN